MQKLEFVDIMRLVYLLDAEEFDFLKEAVRERELDEEINTESCDKKKTNIKILKISKRK